MVSQIKKDLNEWAREWTTTTIFCLKVKKLWKSTLRVPVARLGCYNAEIWLLPTLKSTLKQKLLSCSAHALKCCVKYCTRDISFINLHAMYHRATPDQFMLYKNAINLYRLYNEGHGSIEWVALNFNQILTSRQTKFMSIKANRKKVGINAIANRFYILNNKIPLTWLNLSFASYKLHCKGLFLW